MDQKENYPSTFNPHSRSNLSTDFFQVSINSQKLNEMFTKLNTIVMQQDMKIIHLNSEIKDLHQTFEDRMQKESQANGLQRSKLESRMSENFKNMNMCITEVNEKMQAKNRLIDKELSSMKSKIGRVEDYGKEDLARGLKNLKQELIGIAPQAEESKIDQNSTVNENHEISIPGNLSLMYILDRMKGQIEQTRIKMSQHIEALFTQKNLQMEEREHEARLREALKKKEIEEDIKNYLMEIKSNPINEIRYANIHKEVLGKKEEIMQENKIQMESKALKKMTNQNTGYALGSEQIMRGSAKSEDRIVKVEKELCEKKKQIKEIKNKMIVLDERIIISGRKQDKISQDFMDLKGMMRRIEEKKQDEKAIEDVRNYIKWSISELDEKIEKKCTEQALNREKQRLNEKISIIHENLIEKADKGEITKAIIFLEEKMKEIIFLIAAEHTNERDGAVVKTNVKCLSCDKQMEKTKKVNEKKGPNNQADLPFSKPVTHRVRKRYREQLKQNYTMGNEEIDE